MADDPFRNLPPTLTAPSRSLVSITPDDGNDLTKVVRGIRVGTAGDLVVVDAAGNTTTIPNCQPAEVIICQIKRVLATGTTAGGLVGFE